MEEREGRRKEGGKEEQRKEGRKESVKNTCPEVP